MKKVIRTIHKGLTHPQVKRLIEQVKTRVTPAIEYYKRLNEREKQIVFFAGILVILMFFYLLISAAYTFQKGLEKEYAVIQTYKADVEFLSRVYKDINTLTPNEFSQADANTIKNDLTAISSNAPDVQQFENTVTANVSQAKFSDVLNFLQQARKSYGLFPSKVRVTRLSESGYVSFSASFKVNSQNGQ